MHSGAALKYTLFYKWKEMPDLEGQKKNEGANLLEKKLVNLQNAKLGNALNSLK